MKNVVDRGATGVRIGEIMDEKGISVSELAKTLGLRPATIYKWRKGQSMPEMGTLFTISHLLGYIIDDVIVVYPQFRQVTADNNDNLC